MKGYYLLLLLLFSCTETKVTTSQKIVTLDASPSYITGGDGQGYFTDWQWTQIKGNSAIIKNSKSSVAQTILVPGDYSWQLGLTDNEQHTKKDTLSLIVK